MGFDNPFSSIGIGSLFETLLPDLLLAFTFFTALTYAVLGRRFGQQRPAIAMSAAVGLALASGLVWWEHQQRLVRP
jgi:cyanate permease